MNTTNLIRNWIIITAMLLGFTACDRSGGGKKDPNVDYYTCAMHPSVRSQDPKAKCPICSMDLIPVMKKGHDHGATTEKPTGPMLQNPQLPSMATIYYSPRLMASGPTVVLLVIL